MIFLVTKTKPVEMVEDSTGTNGVEAEYVPPLYLGPPSICHFSFPLSNSTSGTTYSWVLNDLPKILLEPLLCLSVIPSMRYIIKQKWNLFACMEIQTWLSCLSVTHLIHCSGQ